MINSISAVSFKANPQQVTQDPISRIGAYTKQPEIIASPKKKKHTFLKVMAGIATIAAVSAALIYGSRDGRWFKKLAEGAENAKLMEKVSDKLAKAGELLDNKVWKKVAGFFSGLGKKSESAAEGAVESAAEGAVEGAAADVVENIAKA